MCFECGTQSEGRHLIRPTWARINCNDCCEANGHNVEAPPRARRTTTTATTRNKEQHCAGFKLAHDTRCITHALRSNVASRKRIGLANRWRRVEGDRVHLFPLVIRSGAPMVAESNSNLAHCPLRAVLAGSHKLKSCAKQQVANLRRPHLTPMIARPLVLQDKLVLISF